MRNVRCCFLIQSDMMHDGSGARLVHDGPGARYGAGAWWSSVELKTFKHYSYVLLMSWLLEGSLVMFSPISSRSRSGLKFPRSLFRFYCFWEIGFTHFTHLQSWKMKANAYGRNDEYTKESCEASLAPITERLASGNVVMRQQLQWVTRLSHKIIFFMQQTSILDDMQKESLQTQLCQMFAMCRKQEKNMKPWLSSRRKCFLRKNASYAPQALCFICASNSDICLAIFIRTDVCCPHNRIFSSHHCIPSHCFECQRLGVQMQRSTSITLDQCFKTGVSRTQNGSRRSGCGVVDNSFNILLSDIFFNGVARSKRLGTTASDRQQAPTS